MADPGPGAVADPAPAAPTSEQPADANPLGSGPSAPMLPARAGINRIVVVQGTIKPKLTVRRRAALQRAQRAVLQDLREAGVDPSTVVYRMIGTSFKDDKSFRLCQSLAGAVNALDNAAQAEYEANNGGTALSEALGAAAEAVLETGKANGCTFIEVE